MKPDIDLADTARQANQSALHLCQAWLPGGRVENGEYVALNPTRADRHTGSFRINLSKGVWCDFATDDRGDMMDLACYIFAFKGKSAKYDAARRILEDLGRPAPASTPTGHSKPRTRPERIPQPHAPLNAPKPNFSHFTRGEPAEVTGHYKTESGETIGYVCRFRDADGRKDDIPMTWTLDDTGRGSWAWSAFVEPRPVLGLDILAGLPADFPILIVEGEPCARAVNEAHWGHFATCWPGGCKAVNKVDWRPLQRFQDITIWPDNDAQAYPERHELAGQTMPMQEQPGYMAASKIAKVLTHAKILTPLPASVEGWKQGWDVKDAIAQGWSYDDFMRYCQDSALGSIVWTPPGDDMLTTPEDTTDYAPAEEYSEHGPQPPRISEADDQYGFPFRFLGHDRRVHYFLPGTTGQIVAVFAKEMTRSFLQELAPLTYWETNYPGAKGGIQVEAAVEEILRRSERQIFDHDRLRGRGCWIDDGRIVFHAGNQTFVDGMPVRNLETRYIYERAKPIPVDNADPANTATASKFLDLCEALNWQHDLYGRLLAGWCVVAPICGVLHWRPHVWITGSAGTGKTWVLENIVNPMLRKTAVYVTCSTTEAGVRQTLGTDARPVVFDEVESEDQDAQKRVKNVLLLIRQASSDSDANIVKGSPSQKAIIQKIRSCFLLSSITISLESAADVSRTTPLELAQHDPETFPNYARGIAAMVEDTVASPAYCNAIRARALYMAATIRESALAFEEALTPHLGSPRYAAQFGAMLAGAYALRSNRAMTLEAAKEWAQAKTVYWTQFADSPQESEEHKCLNHLLDSRFRDNNQEFRVGHQIQVALSSAPGDHAAQQRLNAIGIKVMPAQGAVWPSGVYVANDTHPELLRIFAGTRWYGRWKNTLNRLPGADKGTKPMWFASGATYRVIRIPIHLLKNEDAPTLHEDAIEI